MTQKAIGEKYGISRNRVSEVVSTTDTVSTGPGAVRDASTDARVKVNPTARPVLANRVEQVESVAQVAVPVRLDLRDALLTDLVIGGDLGL